MWVYVKKWLKGQASEWYRYGEIWIIMKQLMWKIKTVLAFTLLYSRQMKKMIKFDVCV